MMDPSLLRIFAILTALVIVAILIFVCWPPPRRNTRREFPRARRR